MDICPPPTIEEIRRQIALLEARPAERIDGPAMITSEIDRVIELARLRQQLAALEGRTDGR
jgi:hypothetical protein